MRVQVPRVASGYYTLKNEFLISDKGTLIVVELPGQPGSTEQGKISNRSKENVCSNQTPAIPAKGKLRKKRILKNRVEKRDFDYLKKRMGSDLRTIGALL